MKLQNFIFVHDENIILDFIKHNKFNNLSNLTYVFLGYGESSKISQLKNIIIAKNLEYNIEDYPKLTAFSGWYALWKNGFIKGDYVNLFEYDVNISDDLEEKIIQLIDTKLFDVIGYIPFNVHHFSYIKNLSWSDVLISSVKKNYNINISDIINSLPANQECTMTSNHTLSKNVFIKYMEWMDKLIDDIKMSPLSGHQTERSISIFYLLHNIPYTILNGCLEHFQFDSHKTQGISQQKFLNNYKNLLK